MLARNETQYVRDTLSGTDGIVYLMFCGRETYVANTEKPLMEAGLFENPANINQTFKRLERDTEDFIKFVRREEKKPGVPAIYTANLHPIFVTLNNLGVQYDEEELTKSIEALSPLNDYFLEKYVSIARLREHNGRIRYRKLDWHNILCYYFLFLMGNLLRFNRITEILGKENPAESSVIDEAKSRTSIFHICCDLVKEFRLEEEVKTSSISPKGFESLLRATWALFIEITPSRRSIESYTLLFNSLTPRIVQFFIEHQNQKSLS
jgi:hypothetical protein